MPELPEVETVRAGLAPLITGRVIDGVQVLHDRPVRRHELGPKDFETTLVGRVLEEPCRRGKYLWLPLADGDAILAHLGMSGQFRINRAGDPHLPNTRVVFTLGGPDGVQSELRFVDQRMFGGLSVSREGAELPSEIAHIGADPFDPSFDIEAVARKLRTRRSAVKRALLDQKLVSGVGNIYADESLWLAGVHPERCSDSLTQKQAVAVLQAARDVMAEALEQGGTSFDALYVRVNGESGYFDRALNVYGQEGRPCPRCQALVVREPFMNRSSHFCPRCQKAPRPLPSRRNSARTSAS